MNLTGLPPYQKSTIKRKKSKRQDQAFLDWLTTIPCCVCGKFSEWLNGIGKSIACHVRRSNNSGVAYKPLYSAVPMCHTCHTKQHQQGESSLGVDFVELSKQYLAAWKRK